MTRVQPLALSIQQNDVWYNIISIFIYICSMYKIKHFIEWQVFGVCTAIGGRMGIATSVIRRYFIYISFLTLGSPVIFYLFLAFWMNVKNYIKNSRRNPLRYL
jgi:phage shock protein PspC (stress-responsive transcriptional regulator)